MTLLLVALVALGAAIGAPLRYLADHFLRTRAGDRFPWGTLAVNVIGSALLGFLIGLPIDPAVMAVAGTGFSGALTTYSTFSHETLRLIQAGAHRPALANVLLNLTAGLAAAFAAVALATHLTS